MAQSALLGALFVLAAVALIGLPPLAGFVGKIMILRSTAALPGAVVIWSVILVAGFLSLVGLDARGESRVLEHHPGRGAGGATRALLGSSRRWRSWLAASRSRCSRSRSNATPTRRRASSATAGSTRLQYSATLQRRRRGRSRPACAGWSPAMNRLLPQPRLSATIFVAWLALVSSLAPIRPRRRSRARDHRPATCRRPPHRRARTGRAAGRGRTPRARGAVGHRSRQCRRDAARPGTDGALRPAFVVVPLDTQHPPGGRHCSRAS